MKNLVAPVAFLSLAVGCMGAEGKSEPAVDPAAGKADGSFEYVNNGPIAFGERYLSILEPRVVQEWSFELTNAAEVEFITRAAPDSYDRPDTVLRLFGVEDRLLGTDDDGAEGRFSALSMALDAGYYRVTVAGYSIRTLGVFELSAECTGEGCPDAAPVDPEEPEPPVEPADPWILARDVHQTRVAFTDETPIPDSYDRPRNIGAVGLSTPEWWQRWSGGATQSFRWSEGTDYGRRCGQASGVRLQAIWNYEELDASGEVTRPGRHAFQALLDGSGWGGMLYNWTEDVSQGGYPVFSTATLWAWRTGAVKWINVVRPDGSCDLPTLSLVQSFAERCLAQAEREGGAIEGCRVAAR